MEWPIRVPGYPPVIDQTLDILAGLIACDTCNPPRRIGPEHEVFARLHDWLGPAFSWQIVDHGQGRVAALAQRGETPLLFNVHLDTVPAGEGWSGDPLVARVGPDRVTGRGACDIKGAAACLVAAAGGTDQPLAILFTTDEEGSANCCVRRFCEAAADARPGLVIVAEPTGCQVLDRHRGYLSVAGTFHGIPGHTSRHQELENSAVHQAIHWAAGALERVAGFESGLPAGNSLCFNIGRLDGGTKNNMIAGQCRVTWSMRPPPEVNPARLLELVSADANGPRVQWQTTFAGSPLPATDECSAHRRIIDRFCRDQGWPRAERAADFWTEAGIFSEFGMPAIVFGPGDIRQAHAVDEWVSIAQLQQATDMYCSLIAHGS